MTVIATASNPRFSVSRVDIDRGGPTYTIDTLTDLRRQRPDAELFFITGADALAQIVSWRDNQQLFELAHFIGVTRPGLPPRRRAPARGRGEPGRGAGAGDQLDRLPRPGRPRACRSGTWCPTASCSTSRSGGLYREGPRAPARRRRPRRRRPVPPATPLRPTDPASRRYPDDRLGRGAGDRAARRSGGCGQARHRRLHRRRERPARHHRRLRAGLGAQRAPGAVDRRRGRGAAPRSTASSRCGARASPSPAGCCSTSSTSSCTCSTPRSAAYYALERLWKDCPTIPFTDSAARGAGAADAAASDDPDAGCRVRRTRRRPAGDGRSAARAGRPAAGALAARPDRVERRRAASRASSTRRWTRTGRSQAVRAAPHLVAAGLLAGGHRGGVQRPRPGRRDGRDADRRCSGVPVRLDERLREHGMGSWEGLTRAEVAERFPEQYADWMAGRPVRGRGGEEPVRGGRPGPGRARATCPEAPVAVVVTHGGTAGRLMERLLGLGSDHRRVFGPLAQLRVERAGPAGRPLAAAAAQQSRAAAATAAGASTGRSAAGALAPSATATPDGGAPPPPADADAVL